MNLRDQINSILAPFDLDDVAFADISLYRRVADAATPKELLPSARTALVHVLSMDKLREKYGPWYAVSLNNHVSTINRHLCNFLVETGYEARGIQEVEYDRRTLVGKISFRQVALLAGLGSIGTNQMLLHKRLGPGVVFGVVITSAHMPVACGPLNQICIECDMCVSACPVDAFRDGFDRWRCKNRRKILGRGCGTPCVTACPVPQVTENGNREVCT